MKKSLIVYVFPVVSILSCRNDAADEQLSWSCADTHAKPYPTATPECFQKIQSENNDILKFYQGMPQYADGKLLGYSLVPTSRSKMR